MHIVSRMTGNRDLSGFSRMLEMPVAACRVNILPTILLHHFDQIPYFHTCLLLNYTTVNCGTPSRAYGHGLPFK